MAAGGLVQPAAGGEHCPTLGAASSASHARP
jgi:hypothetical protein